MVANRDQAQQARQHFREARKQAFVNEVLSSLSGRPRDLLSFREVQQRLGLRTCGMGHLETVPVAKIVGSEGRYHDFDREFLPLHAATHERWERLDMAFQRMESVPPVELYKAGDVYFVRDGNHRVSVARQRGATYVDAYVIDCPSRIKLDQDANLSDILVEQEHQQFLERTHLDEILGVDIRLTATGAYDALERHLDGHRYFLGQEQQREVPFEEAAKSWYEKVYLPTAAIIRTTGILERFAERTEGDLYIWVLEHHYYLREKYGDSVSLEQAASSFAARYGAKPYRRLLRWLEERAAAVVGAVMSWFRG